MFLFTTPGPSPAPAPATAPVVAAIRQGADATGTDFDYLLRTARRESALDPSAKAPTSSATGLFQFIEQTWLGLVKSDGDRLGLAEEAKAVTARPDGSYAVADPDARQAILDLRKDPQLASVMAGALTRQNRDALVAATGREPSAGELYMAHVLGARGAADLIETARADPSRPAAADFPEAARANRGIFFERGGRARGAGEVYAVLGAAQAGAAQAGAAQPGPARTSAAPAAGGPGASVQPPAFRPPGLQGIFQTGARAGPLSDAVARIWRTNTGGARPQAQAIAFFPRSGAAEPRQDAAPVGETETARGSPADAPAPAAAAAPARAVTPPVPLPPVRPSFAPAALREGAKQSAFRQQSLGIAGGMRP